MNTKDALKLQAQNMARTKPPKWPLWWKAMLSIAAIMLVSALIGRGNNINPSSSPAFDQYAALAVCQHAIKRASIDPENASVPIVPNTARNNDYKFIWGSQSKALHLRNRMGLDAPASGECYVAKETQIIQSLIINGEKFI